MQEQIKTIVEKAKASPAGLTLKIGTYARVNQEIMRLLEKEGLKTSLVTISGNEPGLHVQCLDTLAPSEPIAILTPASPVMKSPEILQLTAKHSTAIKSMRWENGSMFIVWSGKQKKEFEYPNVPESLMLEAIEINRSGGSLGSFVNTHIKPFATA